MARYPRRKQRRPRARPGRWLIGSALALLVLSAGPVVALRWVDPPTSAFMLEYRLSGWLQGERRDVHQFWVSWEAIAPSAKLAVVAAEDQKFPQHWGFDVSQIASSIEHARDGKRLRGASTISQQVAKNLFLWPAQDWVRKGLEAYFTVLIETCWPKRRILEVYLNVAEFGRGVYGVGAAAERYFGKPAAALTQAESALLAAVLPSPRRLRADAPSSYVHGRRAWILQQMGVLGPGHLASL